MKNLEDLPRITQEVLGGLQATPGLRARILDAAAKAPEKKRFTMVYRVAATACAVALCIGAVLLVPHESQSQPEMINTMAAGDAMMDMADAASPEEPLMLMAAGSESVTVRTKESSGSGLWAESQNGAFPMICIDGSCYRMMMQNVALQPQHLGCSMGVVSAYTDQPALAEPSGIMSNVVPMGTEVVAVNGMEHALVIADVDGTPRAFQRVSYNGIALQGSESLADTLGLQGQIASMSMTGGATVDDPAVCELLYNTLVSTAVYESSASLTGRQVLTITMQNGLSVQMMVKGDRLGACGVWSCPEFIQAYERAAN